VRGAFVTGTGTGVGKSVVAAAICAALAGDGGRVAAFKPVVTGLDDEPAAWPPDHELLALVASAGQAPDEVAPYRFGPPASPHLAAELAGTAVDPAKLESAARTAAGGADALVVEGVGGLLVPLAADYLVRDLAAALALALIVVASPGLGTINHCLLTVESARAAGLEVAAVVMTPWPPAPNVIERSNRETVERLAEVPVIGLPPTDPRSLAAAGRAAALDSLVREPLGSAPAN
jgi:dethiobiotin synthetase